MTSLGRVVDGKYRLLFPLGQGGMGSVWVAEHIELRSNVAIKFINAPHAMAHQARQRFRREARAAAALRGPNVVQVFDYGFDAGEPYIVMELLNGETLAQRLGREGRLSIEETRLVALQIANALARAHEQNIVHRDLKPGNIFLSQDGPELTVKLLDFGLAKVVNAQGLSAEHLTLPGNRLGTLQYMSPEQLRGGKVDERTDVWAFGLVVFECLTGRLPFPIESKKALISSIGRDPLRPPSTFADVPPELDAWFARATELSRTRRVSSIRVLAQELQRITAGLSGRCRLYLGHGPERLPLIEAYTSSDPFSARIPSSVPAAINGRRDINHIALISKLSRNTGILWTRHKGELGEWIRLTVHFQDDATGHTTLAKVLRVNAGPSDRPSLWKYELTVRFAQPLGRPLPLLDHALLEASSSSR